MESGLENTVLSAQDPATKAFVAARQMENEGSSKVVLDLESKVSTLKKEKAAVQLHSKKSNTENATLATERSAAAEERRRRLRLPRIGVR